MTSVSSRPHLLTLPRELRNLIYQYLTRELELRGIARLGDSPVIVALDNAPYINVLLTHPRLHDKYKDSSGFLQLSATVTHWNLPAVIGDAEWVTDSTTVERDQAAMRYVKIATVQYLHKNHDFTNDLVAKLLARLVEAMPMLNTLRVAQKTAFGASSSTRPPLPFSSISTTTHSLGLVQLATCVMQTVSFKKEGSSEAHLEKAGQELAIIHKSGVMLVSVYSSQSSRANSWVPERVKTSNIPLRVRQLVKARVPPRMAEALEKSKDRVTRIVNWKEETCGPYKS